MIDDPDSYCPKSPYRDHRHALWQMYRLPWPFGPMIPKRWRLVWECLYCGERAQ